jgi:hypothetical protein
MNRQRTRREVLAAIAGATTLAGCGGQQAQPKQDKPQEDTPSTPSTPVYDRFIEDLNYTFPNIVDATNNSVSIAFYPDRRASFKEEARKDLRLEFYIQFPFTEGGM